MNSISKAVGACTRMKGSCKSAFLAERAVEPKDLSRERTWAITVHKEIMRKEK